MTCEAPTPADAKRSVLVVEDEPLLGDALGRLLIQHGYDAAVALTAGQAVFLAMTRPFDCAIIDIALGETDGVDLARRLLGSARVGNVVFYTGIVEDETLRRALPLGACVEKASLFEDLASAVKAAVSRSRQHDEGRGRG
jgi:DNA-binding response OmpR family regulator